MMTLDAPEVSVRTPGLVPLPALLKFLPEGRPSPQTLWRWTHGLSADGIRLPAIKVGRKWYSTREALDWFLAARTQTSLDRSEATAADDATDDELAAVRLSR